jgi:hypothetical protein
LEAALRQVWRRRTHRCAAGGDVHALDRPGDPRGGVQSDEYRHARPEDVVEEGGVVMGGPGGAPADGDTVEERRDRDRPDESA